MLVQLPRLKAYVERRQLRLLAEKARLKAPFQVGDQILLPDFQTPCKVVGFGQLFGAPAVQLLTPVAGVTRTVALQACIETGAMVTPLKEPAATVPA